MAFIRYKRPYQPSRSERPRICEVIPHDTALKIQWLLDHPQKQTGKWKHYCDNILQLALGNQTVQSHGALEQGSLLPTAETYDKRYP